MASCRDDSVPLRGSLPKRRWSRRMAAISAWRVSTQEFSTRAAVHRSPGPEGRIDGIGILGRPGRQRVVRHSAVPAFPQKQHVDDRGSYGLIHR